MWFLGLPDVEKMKSKKNIKGLIKALEHKKDLDVRLKAADALGELMNASTVEPLINILKDVSSPSNLRRKAVYALGNIGDKRAVEPLITLLTDDLCKDQHDEHIEAAKVLGKIGDKRAVEPLIMSLKSKNISVRFNAAEALGNIGDTQAVEPMIDLLDNNMDTFSRFDSDLVAVGRALCKIGDKRAIETLKAMLMCGQGQLVHTDASELIAGIEKMGGNFGQGKLGAICWFNKLKSATLPADKYDACDKLIDIGEPAVELLIQFLKNRRENIKHIKNRRLARLNPITGLTTEYDEYYYEDILTAAAKILGEIGDKRAVEPLCETLKKSSKPGSLSSVAVEALGKIGDSRAIPHLQQLSEDCFFVVAYEPLKKLTDETIQKIQKANEGG